MFGLLGLLGLVSSLFAASFVSDIVNGGDDDETSPSDDDSFTASSDGGSDTVAESDNMDDTDIISREEGDIVDFVDGETDSLWAALPLSDEISTDTTITLDQDDIDALRTHVQETGDMPNYVLNDNAVVTVEIDGEVDGYLHTLNYTNADVYEGFYEYDHHTVLVWSDSPEAPELHKDEYRDAFGSDNSSYNIVGSAGTVLLDFQTSQVSVTADSIVFGLNEAGQVEFDAADLETAAPAGEYDDLDADTGYVHVGDSFVVFGENNYSAERETIESSLDVLPDGANLDLSATYADQLITGTQNNDVDGTVKTFDISNSAHITVTLDPAIEGTVHQIPYSSEGDDFVMLVRSDSAELPVYAVDRGYGDVFFEDQTIEPIVTFKVGDFNSSTPNGTMTLA